MEDMKELMAGRDEVFEKYLERIIKTSKRIGYYKAQIDLCDVNISGSDNWKQCKYYIEKRNMFMSCRMHEKISLQFQKELLNEYR